LAPAPICADVQPEAWRKYGEHLETETVPSQMTDWECLVATRQDR
jgi:hypothetical protein